VVLTGAFAGVVALAGSRARRWTWLVAAGVAAVAAEGGVPIVLAVVALLVAFAAAVVDRRNQVLGAFCAGAAVQALLRLPAIGFHGWPSLLTAAAIAPVLWSGYQLASRSERRTVRRVTTVLVGVTVLVGAAAGIALLTAKPDVEDAIRSAQAGLSAVQSGDRTAAVAGLDSAAGDFGRAHRRLSAWWARPGRMVPLLGQQLAAVDTLANVGRQLTDAGANAAAKVDYDKLRVQGGAIDLDLLASARRPVADAAAALEDAHLGLAGIEPAWLLTSLRDRYEDLRHRVDQALPGARVASKVVTAAPGLLGADGVRHYFVIVGTPAETRELGGFMGNWLDLAAENGHLSIAEAGRGLALSDPSGTKGYSVPDLPFAADFRDFQVARFFGNITASPDFTEVARLAAAHVGAVSGHRIDGAFYIDPAGLAALLRLTGSVQAPGFGVKLTDKNAEQFLLRDQYIQLPGQERPDVLDDVARSVFDSLTHGDLPAPQRVAAALSPAVDGGHLLAYSDQSGEEALFAALGLDGAMPAMGQADFLEVTQTNQGPNKLDAYVSRELSDEVHYNPATGAVDADLTIRLVSTAPTTGPDDVVGNRHGLPPGTDQLQLFVYSRLDLRRLTVDGKPAATGPGRRFDRNRYTIPVNVPAGATVTLKLHLTGKLAPGDRYALRWISPPMASPDKVDVHIEAAGSSRITRADGLVVRDGVATAGVSSLKDSMVAVDLETAD
jgi:hypothetical protein